nr:hypothetical protein [Bradyrhizobium mercantei]
MERGIDMAALGARVENDAFDQATKSLGGLGAVLRTVQSLGEVGDLLGVELRSARENVRGIHTGFGEQGREFRFASLQCVHRCDHRLLEHAFLDRFDDSVDLLLDLCQFSTPGIATGPPLAVQPVHLLGICAHCFCDDVWRQQPILQPAQHALFELAPRQGPAVRTGSIADMCRADEAVSAAQRTGAIAPAAEYKSRE